eukprot:5456714-Lingulodinium_polyedra.AAC.1
MTLLSPRWAPRERLRGFWRRAPRTWWTPRSQAWVARPPLAKEAWWPPRPGFCAASPAQRAAGSVRLAVATGAS